MAKKKKTAPVVEKTDPEISEGKTTKADKGAWKTIFRTTIEEKDTDLNAYTGAQRLVRLQQNTETKEIRITPVFDE